MSVRFLLDTSVLSQLMQPRPSEAVLTWLAQQTPESLYTTTITVAEIRASLLLMPSGERQLALQQAVEAMFEQDFAGRVWTFDESATAQYASVKAVRQRLGRPISHVDAQIAAIAIVHDATLVTRHLADFAQVNGLSQLNPWMC
jgi:toxin FitB